MTTTGVTTSADGTEIAYESSGSGPALVLVDGAPVVFLERGGRFVGVVEVRAEDAAIDDALQTELRRSRPRLIVTSGGIGSTPDDLTYEAVAASLDRDLVEDPTLAERIHGALDWTQQQGLEVTPALQVPLYLTYLWVPLGFAITRNYGRAGQLPEPPLPGVRQLALAMPELAVDEAPPGAIFLVMTHSHPLDEAICEKSGAELVLKLAIAVMVHRHGLHLRGWKAGRTLSRGGDWFQPFEIQAGLAVGDGNALAIESRGRTLHHQE